MNKPCARNYFMAYDARYGAAMKPGASYAAAARKYSTVWKKAMPAGDISAKEDDPIPEDLVCARGHSRGVRVHSLSPSCACFHVHVAVK